MSDTPVDLETLIDAMAPLLNLELAPEYRPGIATNLEITVRFAALVLEFPLGDHAEPAAVFRP